MVESWRQVARAATLGEHDFGAGLGYGRLSQVQCMTLLKAASDVARGLVGLDRRYSNHLGEFPDARSLRLVLDSQRIVSRDAAAFDTRAATDWSRRATTYLRLIRATNDIGGMVGNGGPAAGEAALAASRIEQFVRAVQAGNEAGCRESRRTRSSPCPSPRAAQREPGMSV